MHDKEVNCIQFINIIQPLHDYFKQLLYNTHGNNSNSSHLQMSYVHELSRRTGPFEIKWFICTNEKGCGEFKTAACDCQPIVFLCESSFLN